MHGGSDFLQLRPEVAPRKGVTTWLVDALRAAIADGRLAAGARLPATRVLAAELGISRGVIVEAYQRLRDEGLVTARTGDGTVVCPHRAPPPVRPLPGRDQVPRPAPGRDQVPPPLVAPRLPAPPGAGGTRVEFDLSPGVPDLSAFPRAAWLRAERHVLDRALGGDLGYGDPRGHPTLRHELAVWLARTRGLRADPDAIMVVAGVAQALALLAHILRRRGIDSVAVEDPGSRGAREALAYWGLRPVPVDVDASGLRVDELARTGVDVVLVTPAHHFPTGVVLSPHRRRTLLDWAAPGRLIIEDDYDAEHRYDRAPVPALYAAAPDRVAHTGSTSKTLSPGMRLGWLLPPRQLRADLVAAKHAADLGNPVLPQLVLARMLATGEYERHLRRVRTRQRQRRDALLAGIAEHLPGARVEGVAAGLHLLITLPELSGRVDDADLADRISSAGVLVHPLSWHRVVPGPPGIVIGYAAHTPDRLREAARRLGAAVRAAVRR